MPKLFNQAQKFNIKKQSSKFLNYSSNEFGPAMRHSLLREHSLESQDPKDALLYEESVLSRVTSNSKAGR